jgi:hypothetical protein
MLKIWCLGFNWHSIMENAIGCAIGSIVAIAASILIYWVTVFQTKKEIDRQRLTEETNQLLGFRLMLEEGIKVSGILLNNLKNMILKLQNHPNNFPLLESPSFGSIRKIVRDITVERTGLTYMKHLANENVSEEFFSILRSIDYLDDEFMNIQETVKRAHLNHYDRVIRVSNSLDLCDKIIVDSLQFLGWQVYGNSLREIKQKFGNERGDLSNIDAVNTLYFLPMRDLMDNLIREGKSDDFVINFTYNITKGIEYYNQLGSGYDAFIGTMEQIVSEFEKSLDLLKSRANRILNYQFNN